MAGLIAGSDPGEAPQRPSSSGVSNVDEDECNDLYSRLFLPVRDLVVRLSRRRVVRSRTAVSDVMTQKGTRMSFISDDLLIESVVGRGSEVVVTMSFESDSLATGLGLSTDDLGRVLSMANAARFVMNDSPEPDGDTDEAADDERSSPWDDQDETLTKAKSILDVLTKHYVFSSKLCDCE